MPQKSKQKPSDAPGRERNASAKRAGWQHRLKMLSPILLAAIVAAGLMLIRGGKPAGSNLVAQSASQPPADPPGTIDGAKNPELIPDEVAYRLLFLAVAEPENATEEQKARARAKIYPAELSEEDAASFLSVADQFRSQVDSLAGQAAKIRNGIAFVHPDSVEGQQLSQLGKDQAQVLVSSLGMLTNKLSAEGFQKLRAHVQSIKRKIKLFPPPPKMPGF